MLHNNTRYQDLVQLKTRIPKFVLLGYRKISERMPKLVFLGYRTIPEKNNEMVFERRYF